MKIFFINGVGGSGKDAFMDFVAKRVRVKKLSTIDRVKEIATECFGWDGSKEPKDRKFLATLRYAWAEFNDGPVTAVSKEVGEYSQLSDDSDHKPHVLFIAVREFPEMMRMQQLLGGETLVVMRPGIPICATEQGFLDMIPSDYRYDVVIGNEGTLEELAEAALLFVEKEVCV